MRLFRENGSENLHFKECLSAIWLVHPWLAKQTSRTTLGENFNVQHIRRILVLRTTIWSNIAFPSADDTFTNSFFFFCLFYSNGSLPGKYNSSFFSWAAEFQFPRVISRLFFCFFGLLGCLDRFLAADIFADSLSVFFLCIGCFFFQVDYLLRWLWARITSANFNTWRLVVRGGD